MGWDEEERDFPPEYCHYRDEGCELADSCLRCPLPACVEDEPGGRQRWLKVARDREVAGMFQRQGKNIPELARVFGVSRRTIQRILKREKA